MSLLTYPYLPNITPNSHFEFESMCEINSPLNEAIGRTEDDHLPSNQIGLWIGLSHRKCLNIIDQYQLTITSFAHWLYIPQLNVILSFKHQRCIKAGKM